MRSNEQILLERLGIRQIIRQDEQFVVTYQALLSAMEEARKEERKESKWDMPTDQQLIEIAILFNEGKVEPEKLSEMVGMCQFVLDRLYENGTITKPTKAENAESPLP